MSELRYLSANANLGKFRRAKLDGRDFYVVPLSMLAPGVLNGSNGPLLYREEDITKNFQAWNGMPITVNHPEKNGQHVSARNPSVMEKQGIGHVYAVNYRKKLRAEGWIDVEKARRVDNRIIENIESGKPMELSTGLFTDNEPNKGTWNGREYHFIARNYRPDHLAFLPDQKGACSIEDGCGVLVNKTNGSDKKSAWAKLGQLLGIIANESEPSDNAEEGVWRTIRGAKVFIEGGKITKGPKALRGKTEEEAVEKIDDDDPSASLTETIKERSKGQPNRIKKQPNTKTHTSLITKIKGFEHSGYEKGKALIGSYGGKLISKRTGVDGNPIETYRVEFEDRDVLLTFGQGAVRDPKLGKLPEEWRIVQDIGPKKTNNQRNLMVANSRRSKVSKLTTEQREEIIDALTANCEECEEDRRVYDSFSDKTLIALNKKFEQSELVTNAATKGVKDKEGNQYTFNGETGEWEVTENECDSEMEDDEEEMPPKKKKLPAMNSRRQLTEDEFFALAPESVKQLVRNSQKTEAREKAEQITKLTTNIKDKAARKAKQEKLSGFTLSQLQTMAEMLPTANEDETETRDAIFAPGGAPASKGGLMTNRLTGEKLDVNKWKGNALTIPTFNYENEKETAAAK